LPADQIELKTPPLETAEEVAGYLARGRADLVASLGDLAIPAAAGVHPLARDRAVQNDEPRYAAMRREYGPVAERQVVSGLHVHVRLSGAERSLAVYNALRSYLPELAALAANAPFLGGEDTGFASIRPKISEGLPRQGIPPVFASFDEVAGAYRWGQRSGALASAAQWWWELRLHPVYGTIEVRVPDQQITPADSAAVAAVVLALVTELATRFDAGEPLPVHPAWRIAQNRWSAARHGLGASLADLDSGVPEPARARIKRLISGLARAARVGEGTALDRAAALCLAGGAERQRAAALDGGPPAAAALLAREFGGTRR
jgi:carboxylate-amine ligase